MKTITAIWLCLICFESRSQDIQYRLGTSSPVQLNPAFCGDALYRNTNYNRLIAGYQGGDLINGAHSFLSYDAFHWNLSSSVGLLVQESRPGKGLLVLRSVSALYAYIMPLNKNITLRYGLIAGLESKQMDAEIRFRYLEFPERMEQVDPVYRSELSDGVGLHRNKNYFKFGFGSIMETANIDAGLSVMNIHRPDWSLSENNPQRKPVLINAHAVYRFYQQKHYRVSAKTVFSAQEAEIQMQGGLQFKSRKLMCALFYRHQLAYKAEAAYLSVAAGYNLAGFQLRIGSEYLLNSRHAGPQFYQRISLLYLFHTSGVRVCRPVFRKKFADETF